VTVAKLMAPFAPFVSDAVYQNLVRSVDADAPQSVHLADWPEVDEGAIDSKLMHDTRLVMRASSLARAARQKAQMKVRQPLASATAFVQTKEQREALEKLADQVIEESNVRALRVVATAEHFAGANAITVPDDLLAVAGEGHVLATDEAGYAVAVDTRLTPDLADEGLARELVHRVQGLRKTAGLEISDRIKLYYDGWDRLGEVFSRFDDYVRGEVLADDVVAGAAPDGATSETAKVEGHEVTLAVAKA
jgi:isoleucyl-tRNA synthetase